MYWAESKRNNTKHSDLMARVFFYEKRGQSWGIAKQSVLCYNVCTLDVSGYNMFFKGVVRTFSLIGEAQYNTIGEFWDEMAASYGLERLRGFGYNWRGGKMDYAIGIKNGTIDGFDIEIELPDEGWESVSGETDRLKEIYDDIYKEGALTYEIEEFFENGKCFIRYYRK